jgi:hypothetical protein
MMNRPGADAGLESRLRVMRLLWGVWLVTVGSFVLVSYVARPPGGAPEGWEARNPPLLYGLAAAAFSAVVASFVVKRIFYRRAAEAGQPAQAQSGFILALALSEAAVICGMVGLFATWDSSAYVLYALGALGIALHFPARGQLEAAYQGAGGGGGRGAGEF